MSKIHANSLWKNCEMHFAAFRTDRKIGELFFVGIFVEGISPPTWRARRLLLKIGNYQILPKYVKRLGSAARHIPVVWSYLQLKLIVSVDIVILES